MDNYEDLLERAIDQLPPEVFEHKRFKIRMVLEPYYKVNLPIT